MRTVLIGQGLPIGWQAAFVVVVLLTLNSQNKEVQQADVTGPLNKGAMCQRHFG